MKHNLELTTIELMITRQALKHMRFRNAIDRRIKAEIIEKIDNTAKADLGTGKETDND